MKLKNDYMAKDAVIQPTELEKDSYQFISTRELIYKIYKNSKTKYQKPNNPVKKGCRDLNRKFSKEKLKKPWKT